MNLNKNGFSLPNYNIVLERVSSVSLFSFFPNEGLQKKEHSLDLGTKTLFMLGK